MKKRTRKNIKKYGLYFFNHIEGIGFILMYISSLLILLIYPSMIWTVADTSHVLGFNITLLLGFVGVFLFFYLQGGQRQAKELMKDLRIFIVSKFIKLKNN